MLHPKTIRVAASYFILIVLVGLLEQTAAYSQEKLYSVSAKGSFTSSSRLFYNVDALDDFSRGQYLEIEGVFGGGVEIRRIIEDTRLQLGLSIEYLSAREDGYVRVDSTRVPVEDGYWTIPVELTGYFIIPFSSETLRMYIGGGFGTYFGERRYVVANERPDVTDSKTGYGIHVVTGVEYFLKDWIALRSEIKFRDLQFESIHAFSKPSTTYNGVTVLLRQEPARSRVSADGMLIDAGIVIRF